MKQFLTMRIAKTFRRTFLLQAPEASAKEDDFWVTIPRKRTFDPHNSFKELGDIAPSAPRSTDASLS